MVQENASSYRNITIDIKKIMTILAQRNQVSQELAKSKEHEVVTSFHVDCLQKETEAHEAYTNLKP